MARRKSIKALPREDLPDPPVDWVWVNLADLAANTANAIVDGPFGSNLKTSHYTESGPRVIRLQNIGDGHFEDERAHISIDHFSGLERHHVQPDDLLVAALGEELPRACLVPHWLGPALVKADCPRIRLNNEISIPEFVCHWLNSSQCRDRAAAIIHGVGRPRMNLAEIRGLWVPIAHPLEQAATAAKVEALFSELDAGVAQLEAAQALLKRFRQSVLKAAFEGRLTAEWREQRRKEAEANGEKLPTAQDLLKQIEAERQERAEQQHAEWHEAVRAWEAAGGKDSGEKKPRKPAKPKDPPPLPEEELESLPNLPEEWIAARLGGITSEMNLGKALDKKKNTGQPRPYLGNINVRWFRFNLDTLATMKVEDHELDRCTLQHGDLVICEGGEPGRCAVWRHDDENMVIQKALHRLRFGLSVSPDFMAQYMRHGTDNGVFRSYYTGTTIKHLTGEAIAQVPVTLCDPDEQQAVLAEIDSRFSVITEVERTIETGLRQASALRQSILKRAFEGRLLDEAELEAVRSHPDYEPAEKLLERIRAHAEASKKTKTPTKKKTTRKKRIARKTQETT